MSKETKKRVKHSVICQSCLRSSDSEGLSIDMFFYVERENHYSIDCIDCIEKYNLKIYKPYKEPRKKKEPKKNTD